MRVAMAARTREDRCMRLDERPAGAMRTAADAILTQKQFQFVTDRRYRRRMWTPSTGSHGQRQSRTARRPIRLTLATLAALHSVLSAGHDGNRGGDRPTPLRSTRTGIGNACGGRSRTATMPISPSSPAISPRPQRGDLKPSASPSAAPTSISTISGASSGRSGRISMALDAVAHAVGADDPSRIADGTLEGLNERRRR